MAERYNQLEWTIREHLAAFNTYDLPRLLGGLAQDITWQTGQDIFRGRDELAAVFSDAFHTIAPTLTLRSLLIDNDRAACELCEHMTVGGVAREDWIAGFYQVDATGVIKSVKIYRQGSADV
jgi:hypothetical protein